VKIARTQGPREAANYLLTTKQGARDLVLHGEAIQKGLSKFSNQRKLEVLHPLDAFPGLEGMSWDKTRALILHGKTGVGKTALAKALLPEALMVTHNDTLRYYANGGFEGLIFDDMSFNNITWKEFFIAITDTSEGRDIHGRHVNGYIPKGTPRIFTTNRPPYGPGGLLMDGGPIRRRTQVWEMLSKEDIVETIYEWEGMD